MRGRGMRDVGWGNEEVSLKGFPDAGGNTFWQHSIC